MHRLHTILSAGKTEKKCVCRLPRYPLVSGEARLNGFNIPTVISFLREIFPLGFLFVY